MCIYELGYYENDHLAAKREKKPTLSKDFHTFTDYPIWKGWPWRAGWWKPLQPSPRPCWR